MNKQEIKSLLERYYNAETSEEEELNLRKFFNQKDVPDEFNDEKEIFIYFDQLSGVQEPSNDLEERIMSSIDYEVRKAKRSGYSRLLITVSGMAAGLLILAGSYFFFTRESEPRDTFSDPEIAYAETMKILYDVSNRLNKGTQAFETVGLMQEITRKSLNEITRPASMVEKKLKPLDRLNKAMEVVGNISNK